MALNFIIPVAPQPPKAAVRAPASTGANGAANSSANSSASRASAGSTSGSGGGGSGSNSNSSGGAAKTSAKGIGGSSRGSPSNRGSTSSTQTQNASASSQSKQGAASSAQTQSTGGSASSTPNASDKPDEPSFIEALAQSQAQAADSVNAVATAAPEEVTGGSKSSKAQKSADADDSAASLGFLAQSLAVMAGNQQPNAAQSTATEGSADGASVDGVSLASGSSIQNIVASLTKGTAAELKAVVAAADDSKSNSAATAAGAADGVGAAQAQMSVGSHFQLNAHTPVVNDKVDVPVGSQGFNEELGGKITWMANQGVQSASVQLSPEHLGPVAVHISVQDGSASVAFTANHADTRAALEQALPRLREMFGAQGLTLSDASVSQQSPRGQSQKHAIAAISAVGGGSAEESTSPIAAVTSNRLGLVDTYA